MKLNRYLVIGDKVVAQNGYEYEVVNFPSRATVVIFNSNVESGFPNSIKCLVNEIVDYKLCEEY